MRAHIIVIDTTDIDRPVDMWSEYHGKHWSEQHHMIKSSSDKLTA